MTKTCTYPVPRGQCKDDAQWAYSHSGALRGYSCEKHLSETEDDFPAAIFLPLDPEDHDD